jgi:hypothetical protein
MAERMAQQKKKKDGQAAQAGRFSCSSLRRWMRRNSLGDYIRLVQLHREMEEDNVREIKVTWVEPEGPAEQTQSEITKLAEIKKPARKTRGSVK